MELGITKEYKLTVFHGTRLPARQTAVGLAAGRDLH